MPSRYTTITDTLIHEYAAGRLNVPIVESGLRTPGFSSPPASRMRPSCSFTAAAPHRAHPPGNSNQRSVTMW